MNMVKKLLVSLLLIVALVLVFVGIIGCDNSVKEDISIDGVEEIVEDEEVEPSIFDEPTAK